MATRPLLGSTSKKVTVAILPSQSADCGRDCPAEDVGNEYVQARQGLRHGIMIASIAVAEP